MGVYMESKMGTVSLAIVYCQSQGSMPMILAVLQIRKCLLPALRGAADEADGRARATANQDMLAARGALGHGIVMAS